MDMKKNIVILREAQIQQVAEAKGPLIQRLHHCVNDNNKLKSQLLHATRDVYLLNRKITHPMMCCEETPNNKLCSNEIAIRDERYWWTHAVYKHL